MTTRRTRNPARTRGNLLAAGIHLFSSRGFHGVAVDEIVAEAGCNKRMLYHYFGDKERLYVEVLQTVYARMEQVEMTPLPAAATTAEKICEIMERHFTFLATNQEFVNLLMWENLNEGRLLARHPHLLSKTPIIGKLHEILEEARQRGEISADGDTRHLVILMIGLCFIHFSNRYTLQQAIGLDLTSPTVQTKGLQQAQVMFLSALGLVHPNSPPGVPDAGSV